MLFGHLKRIFKLNRREQGRTSVTCARANWVDAALEGGLEGRDRSWTESLAVGSDDFVEGIKLALGIKGRYREVTQSGDVHVVREPAAAYSGHFGHEMGPLSAGNALFWEQS